MSDKRREKYAYSILHHKKVFTSKSGYKSKTADTNYRNYSRFFMFTEGIFMSGRVKSLLILISKVRIEKQIFYLLDERGCLVDFVDNDGFFKFR